MKSLRIGRYVLEILISLITLIFLSESAFAGNATISWNANTESDLAGYKIYYGTSPRGSATRPNGYASIVDVPRSSLSNPASPSYTLSNLTDNTTYYFAVTAYDTSSNESAYSTEVSKTVAPTSTVSNVKFTARLDGNLAVANRNFTISFFSPGMSNLIGQFTAQPDGTGNVVMPGTLVISPGTYDIVSTSPLYLKKRQVNIAINSNVTVTLPILPGGDLNSDNTINSLDWSLMSPQWNKNNAGADINKDSIVNSIDFSFMNKNWMVNGDN